MPAQDKEEINTYQNSNVKADMSHIHRYIKQQFYLLTFFYIQNQDGFLNSSFGSE